MCLRCASVWFLTGLGGPIGCIWCSSGMKPGYRLAQLGPFCVPGVSSVIPCDFGLEGRAHLTSFRCENVVNSLEVTQPVLFVYFR